MGLGVPDRDLRPHSCSGMQSTTLKARVGIAITSSQNKVIQLSLESFPIGPIGKGQESCEPILVGLPVSLDKIGYGKKILVLDNRSR